MNSLNELIESMIFSGVLKSPKIIDAFKIIDRKYFIPKEHLDKTYIDAPLPIGKDQTISQPSTVAFMLELLNPNVGDKVLDIGSGSGWTTALLCQIVGDSGSVIGVERVDELVKKGSYNLSKFKFLKNCKIQKADQQLGITGETFDKILVSASADKVPNELFKQLKTGGTLVIPIKNSIFKFIKTTNDEIKVQEFPGFVFVPLITNSQ